MQIHYPFPTTPDAGTAFDVAPGIAWLRMPLPYALDHINLWLLQDGDGWTAIDTGIALDSVKEAWRSALTGCNAPHGARRLTRQIVTHFHPDHLGLAGWLEAETGAGLWMTQGEYLTARLIAADVHPFGVPAMLDFFRLHGLDASHIEALDRRGNAYQRGVPAIPARYHRLMEGDTLTIGAQEWRVIVGYGHAPEHASLYCAALGVLIAGDMLLPRITTNISAFAAAPEFDSLGVYLRSLDRLAAELPTETLVLPSHGRPFCGVQARVAELKAHHEARCADLMAACREKPSAAAELLTVLFGRPIEDAHQTLFAMGEAIAHLNYLEAQGKLRRLDCNGIIRFSATP